MIVMSSYFVEAKIEAKSLASSEEVTKRPNPRGSIVIIGALGGRSVKRIVRKVIRTVVIIIWR